VHTLILKDSWYLAIGPSSVLDSCCPWHIQMHVSSDASDNFWEHP